MADTMDKVLKNTFKQLQFNSMPKPVREQFYEWVKNNTLTHEMTKWTEDYLEHTDPKDKTSPLKIVDDTYVQKSLPDLTKDSVLSDEEARKLFVEFQKAFVLMKSKYNDFARDEPDAAEFCNRYYGTLFKVAVPTKIKSDIDTIIQLVDTNHYIRKQALKAQSDDGKKLFETESKLEDFINKCKSGKYDTDASVQKQVHSLANGLSDILERSYYYSDDITQPLQGIKTELEKVSASDAFALDPKDITNDDLDIFRKELLIYDDINRDKVPVDGLLTTLYENKTVRDRFEQYDLDKKITKPINEAVKKVNWQDKESENFVPEKNKDTLNTWQQIEKWTSDTYSDSLKKYEQLRGGSVFFKIEAKNIFKAIDSVKVGDKKGIKPTDGLGALLDNKDAIIKKINDPTAREHFKWFATTMESVKDAIPKAIAGAWKDSRQMKAVIEQIILKAVTPPRPGADPDPEAIEKAKTAMEIMTAMKYGMLTSRTMDAIKQTDFTVFSDGKLSWNNNEGVQFVTKAFDKSVRAAFLGIGYGCTFVRNKMYLHNMNFTKENNNTGNLNELYNKEQKRINTKGAAETARLASAQEENRIKKLGKEAELATFNSEGYREETKQEKQDELDNIERTHLQRYKDGMANAKTRIDAAKEKADQQRQAMEQNAQGHSEYQQSYDKANFKDVDSNIRQLELELQTDLDRIQELENKKKSLSVTVLDASGVPLHKDEQESINEELKPLYADIVQIKKNIALEKNKKDPSSDYYQNEIIPAQNIINDKEYQNANAKYLHAESELNAANTDLEAAQNEYDRNEADYNNGLITSGYKDKKEKLEKFKTATKELEELNKTSADLEKAMEKLPDKNRNKIIELEDYWNWLQSGATKTWRLSTKNAQKDFDKNKQRLLANYLRDYSLAA